MSTRDGNIVVVDRLKELIKVNAFQVAPAEVEAVIVGHPAVADVAVVGAPDARTGETPIAYVVACREVDPDDPAGMDRRAAGAVQAAVGHPLRRSAPADTIRQAPPAPTPLPTLRG